MRLLIWSAPLCRRNRSAWNEIPVLSFELVLFPGFGFLARNWKCNVLEGAALSGRNAFRFPLSENPYSFKQLPPTPRISLFRSLNCTPCLRRREWKPNLSPWVWSTEQFISPSMVAAAAVLPDLRSHRAKRPSNLAASERDARPSSIAPPKTKELLSFINFTD